MTDKEKDLLLKDLCSRLNTNLVCSIYRTDDIGIGYRDEILHGYYKVDDGYEFYFGEDCGISIDNISKIKPYLFPLSSMTEEEKLMYEGLMIGTDSISYMLDVIDWLNEHHFDYRGLIGKSLALDATNLGVYE